MKKTILQIAIPAVLLLLTFALTGCACEHDFPYSGTVTTQPTCTEDGIETISCRKCGLIRTESVPASHNFIKDSVITPSTCTENGLAIYKCSGCNETEERTEFAKHSFSGKECTVCKAIKSDIVANEWYYNNGNDVLKFRNADVRSVTPVSSGREFLVSYYPVCTSCHLCGLLELGGCTVDTPKTYTHYCDYCDTISYVNFKIEY